MKKKLFVFLCFSLLCVTLAYSQSHVVTGMVTGKDDGNPIPGVTVKVKGNNIGSQTNVNGKFGTLFFFFGLFNPGY
jgi:hypothetical protein